MTAFHNELVRLRVSPLGDTLRIALLQRPGLSLAARPLAWADLAPTAARLGESRIVEVRALPLLTPPTDDPIGYLHLSARRATTSTIGREAALKRIQATARVIVPRAVFLRKRRFVRAIQAHVRGMLARRTGEQLRDAGVALAVSRIQVRVVGVGVIVVVVVVVVAVE